MGPQLLHVRRCQCAQVPLSVRACRRRCCGACVHALLPARVPRDRITLGSERGRPGAGHAGGTHGPGELLSVRAPWEEWEVREA
jgi:hypothetical protein